MGIMQYFCKFIIKMIKTTFVNQYQCGNLLLWYQNSTWSLSTQSRLIRVDKLINIKIFTPTLNEPSRIRVSNKDPQKLGFSFLAMVLMTMPRIKSEEFIQLILMSVWPVTPDSFVLFDPARSMTATIPVF